MSSFIHMRPLGFLRYHACLLLIGLVFPFFAYSAEQVTIDITTSAGTQTYEVVRLYPGRVILLDPEGKRVEIQRSQIKKASNTKVEASIKESKALLEKVPKTTWEDFPVMGKYLEQAVTEMDQTSLLYGWLIPDASTTATELQAIDVQVSQTLVIGTALEKDLLTLPERVKNGERLPKNWEGLFDEGAKRAAMISFPLIQKVFTSRIQTDREKIKSIVTQITTEKMDLIHKTEEGMRLRLQDPAFTREEWNGLLGQMKQNAEQIPEEEAYTQVLKTIEEIQARTETFLLANEGRKAFSPAIAQLEKIRNQIAKGELNSASGQEQIRVFLNTLADLPDAPTREQLATRANEIAATLSPLPTVESGEGTRIPDTTGSDQATSPQNLLQSLLASNAILGGVVGVVVVLSLGGIFLIIRRKKKSLAVLVAAPAPEPVSMPVSQPKASKKSQPKRSKKLLPKPAPAENVIALPVRPQITPIPVPEESIISHPPSVPAPVEIEPGPPPVRELESFPEVEFVLEPEPFDDQPIEAGPPICEAFITLEAPTIEEEPITVEEPAPPVSTPLEVVEGTQKDSRPSEGSEAFEIPLSEILGIEPIPEPLKTIPDSAPIIQTAATVKSEEAPRIELPSEPVRVEEPVLPSEPVKAEEPALPSEPVTKEEPELPPEPPTAPPDLYLFLPEESEDWRSKLEEVCVTAPHIEDRLRGTLVLGEETPEKLARYGQHFGASLRNGEGKTTLALVDRLSTAEGVLSCVDAGPGAAAVDHQFGQLWILNQECLCVSGYGEGGWIELGRLNHPVSPSTNVFAEPLQPTLSWVGEKYLVGISTNPHIYKVEKADCLLHVEPVKDSSTREFFSSKVYSVFTTSDELGTVSRDGVLALMDPSGEKNRRQMDLPECDTEAPPGTILATSSGQLLYPARKNDGTHYLKLLSLTTLKVIQDSERLPFVLRQVVQVEEGFLLLGEHEVAFIDEVDLTVIWTYPLGSRVPVALDAHLSQVALLVHDEEAGDTVLVLGKNSGADLWDLSPGEHDLKKIQSLIFNVDWTLLLGQDKAGKAVLKLC